MHVCILEYMNTVFCLYSKSSLPVKKGTACSKWPVWIKFWNERGQSRNGCDGMDWWQKFLITTIQDNLCCLIPASLGISTKFTWIVVIKIFAINLYHHFSTHSSVTAMLPRLKWSTVNNAFQDFTHNLVMFT